MNCPACTSVLQMTERSGVEIDYCPKCRGVWLDRGELDKLIERAERDAGNARSFGDRKPQYDSDDRRPQQYDSDDRRSSKDSYPKKKESFWGELFDFG